MLFKQNEIEIHYDDNLYTINHEQINAVILSMCSRLYNPGIIENNPAKWVVKKIYHRINRNSYATCDL